MIFIAIAFGVLVLLVIAQWVIIRDLLTRVMAGSLREYRAVTDDRKPAEPASMNDRAEYELYCKQNGITPEKEVE